MGRCFRRLLPLLLLLTVTAVMQAQFNFTTNSDNATYTNITITGYTGPGGDVAIPDMTNGLPVTGLGNSAFIRCTRLTSVTIPSSVTTIGQTVFALCGGLTNIVVATQNPSYSGLDGVLFDKNQTTLIEYPGGLGGSYAIPNSVTYIGHAAFIWCYNLSSVTMGTNVVIVGDGAFAHDTSLTNVTIPDSVTYIGNTAFAGSGLTTIAIPNSVTNVSHMEFFDCADLTSVTIPESVHSIADAAFGYCTSLTNVTIPNSVSIGVETFYLCTSLTSLTIGNGVTSIGDNAFDGCSSLASVTMGNGVTSIGGNAFAGCAMNTLTIPNSVTNIGMYAFADCDDLTAVYFKGNAPSNFSPSGMFTGDNMTIYYLPGTTGWGRWYQYLWPVLWNPSIQTTNANFGVRSNRFGFNITGTADIPIAVVTCTNPASPTWVPLQSCTLTNGSIYFSDPDWTNYPARLYRIRSP